MKGYIGCNADLEPGIVVVSCGLRMVIVAKVTEEEALESASAMGMPLDVRPGEYFYEVEVATMPVGSNN